MNDEGDRTEHQRQLWSALDLAMHALAFHVLHAIEEGGSVPMPAVRYLETARAIAIEGLGYEEADRVALERLGTSDEWVERFCREFMHSHRCRVNRDHFEGAYADELAEFWGRYKRRPPRSLADIEDLISELWEIIERPPDDPKRQELLDFVPGGNPAEVREVLSRRCDR